MRMNLPSAAAITAAVALGLAAPAWAGFTGGPSVRVNANNEIEFKWITDPGGGGQLWFGDVAVFDNADATGNPVARVQDEDAGGNPIPSTQHTVTFPVDPVGLPGALPIDTGYFFRVTATDPNGSLPPFSTPTPLPPFFTGAQAIDNVLVQPGMDSALISWEANVIGFGQVDFGFTTPGDVGTLSDTLNITDHAIELTGLSPETTYVFRVSNLHAIDGDALVSRPDPRSTEVLSFTTLAVPEPSAFALAALGVLGVMARARRRTWCPVGNRANHGLATPASLQ